MSGAEPKERIGLVAGWGRYPLVVAEALRRQGFEVCCVGIKDHADPALGRLCHRFRQFGVAHLGGQIRFFRRHGVRRATMAGKVFKHRLLYGRFGWIRHLPDWQCIRAAYPHFVTRTKDRRDDTLLLSFVQAFARAGITFVPATDFAPELLVKQGILTRRRLTAAEWKDIEFGWQVARQMGRLDVGQAVVVKGRATIAVEAIEGTDQCILRAGRLCPQGGFTVVKVAKPQQDMRFDVPTVGLGTLQAMVQAGGRVLAVEADRTILIDRAEVVRFADAHRLSLVALTASQVAAGRAA